MENLLFVFFLTFVCGLIVFSVNQKHFLFMLLSLEFLVLSVYVIVYLNFITFDCGGFFSVIFLTFSVCEGVLGLSIMISLVRTHGNDYFQSFSLLW